MPKKVFKPEEIVQHLSTVEIERAKGSKLEEAARKVGVTPQTIARWQKEFGTMNVDKVKRLKELEQENSRLKRLVPEQAIDISNLKEVAKGNF